MNPEKYLNDLNNHKQSYMQTFTRDFHTYFHTFHKYIHDFIHAEEYAFLRRILTFDFQIPIDRIFPQSGSLAALGKKEFHFFFMIA
jgi:hypothetical protein